MDAVYAVILGLLEGTTEFLPISSTAHLLIGARFLGLAQSEYWKFFEVFIQTGAILSVVILFFRRLIDIKIITNVAASFIPTAIVGLLLHGIIKNYFFENLYIVAGALIVFGSVFIVLERFIADKKLLLARRSEEMTLKHAVIIGLFQSLAVVPGVSRAGAVLVGAMLLGYRRREAALYSFLLAVPTIVAAGALDTLKTDPAVLRANIPLSVIGFFAAFLSALVVTRWFIAYLSRHSLSAFGIYRIILGAALIFFMRALG